MPIAQRSAADVAEALEAGELRVLDVRTARERDYVSVDGSEALDQAVLDDLLEGPRDVPLAFLCHHGVRSQQAAQWFAAQGFTELTNVVGGIEAWAVEVDPRLPRY